MNQSNNEEDPLAQHYRDLRILQNRHDRGSRAICCFGCTSPEVLLAQLIVFLVANNFFDNSGNYDVKRLEGIAIYILAFCVVAALITSEKCYMMLAGIICIIGVIWQSILVYLLIITRYELNQESNFRPVIIEFVEDYWLDVIVYLKKLIYEDYTAHLILNVGKIFYIGVLLITEIQVNFVQTLKKEINQKHRLIGVLLQAQMHDHNRENNGQNDGFPDNFHSFENLILREDTTQRDELSEDLTQCSSSSI